MNLKFTKTFFSDVLYIESTGFEDERGWLTESYNQETFAENGINEIFLQEKHSFSKKNVLRGLHFQKEPFGQSKLVRCSFGKIFDVVVDIRPTSSTYGKWLGIELSSEKKDMLYIPPGFAHGFLVLSNDGAYFSYLLGKSHFNKKYDCGIYFNDPDININWPVRQEQLILSKKDKNLHLLNKI